MKKRITLALLCMLLIMTLAMPSVSIAAEGTVSGTIEVWTFLSQDEIDSYKEMYAQVNPNVTVNATVFPGDQFMTKVQAALRSGVNCPDVITFEIAQFGQVKDTPFIENLAAEPYNGEMFAGKQIPYVAELSRDSQGILKGLSFQSTPGGVWYRKDLALKYLGTDDHKQISEMINSWDKIIELGPKVFDASQGAVALFDSADSANAILLNARETAFVDANNNLMPMSFFRNIMETMKSFRDNNVDSKRNHWTAPWAAGVYSDSAFIMVGLPSWGLHYYIKANTPADAPSENTWGFAYAPTGYQMGGTWMTMYSGSTNKEAAWDFIRTTTVDEKYLDLYVQRTGDMVGYIPAIENVIASGFRDKYTGDQAIYEDMYQAAMNVVPKPMTKYDAAVQDTFNAQMALVLDGQIDIDTALKAFGENLVNSYPELNIVE